MAPIDPKRWHTREDSGLRLDRQLTWWHDGEKIEHPNIIEAFNRGVRVEPDGRVTLHFGNDWCFIEVEDAAYRVVAVDVSEGELLSIRLSDRTAELLDLSSLTLDEEGVLNARVKGGLAKARFTREAQFQLAERFEPVGERLGVRVGARVELTSIPGAALDA